MSRGYTPVSHTEMRMVFGIKDVRKFTRQGIRVHGLCYFVDELAQEFRYRDEVEIAWWPGNIGAIGVKKRDGRWINVLCVEERWLGKSHLEHRAFLQKNLLLNLKHQEIYDNAIEAMDEFAWGRKGKLGLLSTCSSPEELREEEARLWRYIDTAERRLNAGKPRDLFEDEVSLSGAEEAPAGQAPEPSADENEPRSRAQEPDLDIDDIME